MTTGELIRKYRKMRGCTQLELGRACGMSDAAIRNYELGNRTPGTAQIGRIAEALRISPSSLSEVQADTAREALELLFHIADKFGLEPKKINGELVLACNRKTKKAPKLNMALKAWHASYRSCANRYHHARGFRSLEGGVWEGLKHCTHNESF